MWRAVTGGTAGGCFSIGVSGSAGGEFFDRCFALRAGFLGKVCRVIAHEETERGKSKPVSFATYCTTGT